MSYVETETMQDGTVRMSVVVLFWQPLVPPFHIAVDLHSETAPERALRARWARCLERSVLFSDRSCHILLALANDPVAAH